MTRVTKWYPLFENPATPGYDRFGTQVDAVDASFNDVQGPVALRPDFKNNLQDVFELLDESTLYVGRGRRYTYYDLSADGAMSIRLAGDVSPNVAPNPFGEYANETNRFQRIAVIHVTSGQASHGGRVTTFTVSPSGHTKVLDAIPLRSWQNDVTAVSGQASAGAYGNHITLEPDGGFWISVLFYNDSGLVAPATNVTGIAMFYHYTPEGLCDLNPVDHGSYITEMDMTGRSASNLQSTFWYVSENNLPTTIEGFLVIPVIPAFRAESISTFHWAKGIIKVSVAEGLSWHPFSTRSSTTNDVASGSTTDWALLKNVLSGPVVPMRQPWVDLNGGMLPRAYGFNVLTNTFLTYDPVLGDPYNTAGRHRTVGVGESNGVARASASRTNAAAWVNFLLKTYNDGGLIGGGEPVDEYKVEVSNQHANLVENWLEDFTGVWLSDSTLLARVSSPGNVGDLGVEMPSDWDYTDTAVRTFLFVIKFELPSRWLVGMVGFNRRS